jgi:DNA invertase Pin-like site-specific DNA recombinase
VTPRLASVPDTPPRAVLYLRQSVDGGDDSISIELQETACREHCQRLGYEVVAVHSDPGTSGRTWKRSGVVATLALVEAGDADVVVLWKWSRLSRRRLDWAVAVDRVESIGGRIESATEPVDASTSTGRFTRGMLAELAAFESDRIGDVWREVHQRRIRNGLAHSGKPRWGYVYDRDAKMHVPDPDTAPLVTDTYRRYVAGESIYSLVRWLNNAGSTTSTGQPWSDRTLRRGLDSGFAAGFITYDGVTHPGAHQPLITPRVWAAYQAARRERAGHARTERSQYLLSGMVRCGLCGGAMQAGQFGNGRTSKYRCRRGKETGIHDGGYITASFVEGSVRTWLETVAADIDDATVTAAAAHASRARRRSDAARLAREVTALDRQLVELTKQLTAGVVPAAVYAATRDDLMTARDAAAARQLLEEDRARMDPVRPGRAAAALLAQWDTLPVENRRALLRRLIARVVVTPGRPRGTVEIVPTWQG